MTPIKLITTDRSLPRWRSLPSKLAAIVRELNTIEGADFRIDVEYRDIIPAVVNHRITHEWMDSLVSQVGGEFVALHMSAAQAKKWGIRPAIRGASQIDDDLVHEFYQWADEDTRRDRRNQFEQTFMHEFRHGFMRGTGLPDNTHELHADGDIRGAFHGLRMADYSPRQRLIEHKLTLIDKLRIIIKSMTNNTTLYEKAKTYLGKDASPRDRAPDEVGCAESVSTIIQDVLPDFPIITGTYTLWKRLEADPRFRRVTVQMPGTIIISPTGTVKANIPGHVGIFANGELIMSNDSFKGTWQENYNLTTWHNRWGKAGYPNYYYQLIT